MAQRSKKGIVAALIAWCIILGLGAAAYRYLVAPMLTEQKEAKEEQSLIADTSASSAYDHTVVLQLDGFSGYAVLRSDLFRKLLKNEDIRLQIVDDEADYTERMKALDKGKAQFAAFPLNSFIQAGAKLGSFPASIITIIDETQGADAIVSYKAGLGAIQDMDNPEARMVYTPDSPSEFLAEVTIESFILPKLSEKWRVTADGSEDILRMMKGSNPQDPVAYVLWEPQVSEALELDGVHVLLDSSKTSGYILDTLVVNREFLRDHPEVVRTFVEMYCRALFTYQTDNGMTELVREDAGLAGQKLPKAYADNIVKGINWKNTTDNYAYFGLIPGGGESIEDIIQKITRVMIDVDMLPGDPLNGRPATIYYDRTLRDMKGEGFHPGKKLNVIATDLGLPAEQASAAVELRRLSDSEWERLRPVGSFQVEQIRFPRMSDKITLQNERKLQALAQRLKDWPSYYITIIGQSKQSSVEDLDALALDLAERRAQAAAGYLVDQGIPGERLRVQARLSEAEDWSALNLLFQAGQIPY